MTYHRIYVNIVDTLPVRGDFTGENTIMGDKPWKKGLPDAALHHHFGVILFAALLTHVIPLGKYDTKNHVYAERRGKNKNRSGSGSFQYILDENGNKVTKAAPIFGTETLAVRGIFKLCIRGYDRRR